MSDTVQVFGVDIRNKVRRDFPFVVGAWVEFWDDAIMRNVLQAQDASDKTSTKDALSIIVDQIADWNFSDETNTKVTVSIEAVELLGVKSLKWLSETAVEVTNIASQKADTEKKELPVS